MVLSIKSSLVFLIPFLSIIPHKPFKSTHVSSSLLFTETRVLTSLHNLVELDNVYITHNDNTNVLTAENARPKLWDKVLFHVFPTENLYKYLLQNLY